MEISELNKYREQAYEQIVKQTYIKQTNNDTISQSPPKSEKGALKLMEHIDFELNCLKGELSKVTQYEEEIPQEINQQLQSNLDKNTALQWLLKMFKKFQSLRLNLKQTNQVMEKLLTVDLSTEPDSEFFLEKFTVDYQKSLDKLQISSLNMSLLNGYFRASSESDGKSESPRKFTVFNSDQQATEITYKNNIPKTNSTDRTKIPINENIQVSQTYPCLCRIF